MILNKRKTISNLLSMRRRCFFFEEEKYDDNKISKNPILS